MLMLSTQILVQSYTWTHFQFTFLLNLMFTMLSTQISYKYHIYAQCILQEIPINRILHLNYHVKYTDFSSILYLDAFSFHLSVKSHVFHVMYTDFSSILYLDAFSFHLSVKSHVFHVMCTDFWSILYLDTFSVHLSVKFHFTIVKYTDFSSIIYLDTFSVQLFVNSHVTIVKYTDFRTILYLDTFSVHLFVKSHVTMLSIQISYKYHIYAQCILQEIPINRILHLNYHVKYTDFSSILLLGRIFIPSFR